MILPLLWQRFVVLSHFHTFLLGRLEHNHTRCHFPFFFTLPRWDWAYASSFWRFSGLLVLGQEAEQQEEQQQTEERPSEGQQVEQQPAETEQTEEQQPSGEQRGGLKACKPTDLFPGPNAILIAPELTVEFDADSKAIRNISFQAAPGWAPDSLSSCTVREGRSVPPPGKKVSQAPFFSKNSQTSETKLIFFKQTQCANGGIAFGVIEGEDRLLVSNLRRSNAEIVEPPTFQLDFVLINET